MADLNIKNVPDEVLQRLAAQAESEGLSMQEWVRRTLAHRSVRITDSELEAIRGRNAADAVPLDDFLSWQAGRRLRPAGA